MIPTQLMTAQQATRTYFLTVPEGTTLDQVTARAFWAHTSRLLQPGFKVEVLAEDMSWWAVLMCMDSGKNEALMTVLDHRELQPAALEADTAYDVKFRGPKKFCIIRKSDATVVEENIPTKEQAAARLAARMAAA